MSALTVFYQECPICGRSLRVPVKYYGKPMACSHCEGVFEAGKQQIADASAESDRVLAITSFLPPPVLSPVEPR